MIIVVPVSKTDADVGLGFIKSFNHFGPYPNHKLLVVCRPNAADYAEEVLLAITNKNQFQSIDFHVFDDDGPDGWPRGCNHYWAETAKYLDDVIKSEEPWLWLEMDMVPIKQGWADDMYLEYKEQGKPFLGNLGNTTTVTSEQEVLVLCKHLVGAAIYPPNLDKYSKLWRKVQVLGVAWDVLCQWEFVPNAHETSLMQHVYRTCKYTKTQDESTGRINIKGEMGEGFEKLKFPEPYDKRIDIENVVLVHGCTDNSLADIICEGI